MNFNNLIPFSASVVLAFAAVGKLDRLQMWVWKAQVQVLHESRASNWGSPRFFVVPPPNCSDCRNGTCKKLNFNRGAELSFSNLVARFERKEIILHKAGKY